MRKNNRHEMKEVHQGGHSARSIVGGFLVGSAIGVATALLFAPRAGDETRAELRDRAMDLRDRTTETVRDTVAQARTRAEELREDVVEKAGDLKRRGKQVATRKLDDVAQATETGKQKVQDY